MAAPSFTEEDVLLLGYSRASAIRGVPEKILAFHGETTIGLEPRKDTLIYVLSDATRDDLENICAEVRKLGVIQVFTSKSGPSPSMLTSVFKNAKGAAILENVIWDRLRDSFEKYRNNLLCEIAVDPNFVAPRGEEVGPRDRLDQYLYEKIKNSAGPASSELLVLKASAGVGKTTLCRVLAKQLAEKADDNRVVPIYVESSHWAKKLNAADSAWEVFRTAIEQYSGDQAISQSLFEYALRKGFVAFIFDGFDELCGNRRFSLSAREVLDDLIDFTKGSPARILLTTRTQYWDQEIGSDPENVRSISLLSFNPQQAKQYLKKRFSHDDALFERAANFYADIVRASVMPKTSGGARASFANLPICISMVCEAVMSGVSSLQEKSSLNVVEGLMRSVCERERIRQTLSLTAADQLEIFKEVALLSSDSANDDFSPDDLVAAGAPDADVRRMGSHPLLKAIPGGRIAFSYDFVAPFLKAIVIASELTGSVGKFRGSVIEAMRSECSGRGLICEHLGSILEGVSEGALAQAFLRLGNDASDARGFVFHLVLDLLEPEFGAKSVSDRTNIVFEIVGHDGKEVVRRLANIRFSGVIDKLDFAGVAFESCTFSDVIFRDCASFDGASFSRCIFDGSIEFDPVGSNQQLAKATLTSCELRGDVRVVLEPMLSGRADERQEFLKDLLDAGLCKFWHNGRFKGSLRKSHWKKGSLGRSRFSDALLDALIEADLLQEATISGVREGGWVFDRDNIADLQRFIDARQLGGKIAVAFEALAVRCRT